MISLQQYIYCNQYQKVALQLQGDNKQLIVPNMYINEPALKGNKRKPKTMAKNINQYQFSLSSPQKNNQISNQPSLYDEQAANKKRKFQKQKVLNTIVNDQTTQMQYMRSRQLGEGEMQFEDNLVYDLDQLLKKWKKGFTKINEQLSNYQHIQQTQSQKRAYQQCVNLLQADFFQAQTSQQATTNLIAKKILQIDDYKKRLTKQIKQTNVQNQNLAKQIQALQQQQKVKEKQLGSKKNIIQKINEERQKAQKLKVSLMECKQKSYEQKNQFVEIQSQQFRIEAQLCELEQDERKHEQEQIINKKYEQLLKIKQRVIMSQQCTEQQIRPHLQRKIQKMSKLRSELKSIDSTLQMCISKIQDQNIVIDALKEKSYHQQIYRQQDNSGDLYEMYKKRYSQLYFGEKGSSNADWKTYNSYLRQLINKNKKINSRVYTEMPKTGYKMKNPMLEESNYQKFQPNNRNKMATSVIYNSDYFDLKNNLPRRDYEDKFNQIDKSTQLRKQPERYQSQRITGKKDLAQVTKLPKIIKVDGKMGNDQQLKKKVKEGLAKQQARNTNNYKNDLNRINNSKNVSSKNIVKEDAPKVDKKYDSIQLESVKSGQSEVSGQLIEVQFHRK